MYTSVMLYLRGARYVTHEDHARQRKEALGVNVRLNYDELLRLSSAIKFGRHGCGHGV